MTRCHCVAASSGSELGSIVHETLAVASDRVAFDDGGGWVGESWGGVVAFAVKVCVLWTCNRGIVPR